MVALTQLSTDIYPKMPSIRFLSCHWLENCYQGVFSLTLPSVALHPMTGHPHAAIPGRLRDLLQDRTPAGLWKVLAQKTCELWRHLPKEAWEMTHLRFWIQGLLRPKREG